ncbi:MAG: Rrf2 family transcriptional regulator [Saccharofermentans sp.]|nr:Rrf2 family transcriptional regulator [Saccharofermentans sp.]
MITTRARYAIRVLIDIAEHDEGSFIPLKEIALRQGISKKYLELIVKEMVSSGLLFGASGKGGGYKLSKKPGEYCIGEIIEIMDGPLVPVTCMLDGANPCPRSSVCETLPMWTEYGKLTHEFFYGRYLSELIKK